MNYLLRPSYSISNLYVLSTYFLSMFLLDFLFFFRCRIDGNEKSIHKEILIDIIYCVCSLLTFLPNRKRMMVDTKMIPKAKAPA